MPVASAGPLLSSVKVNVTSEPSAGVASLTAAPSAGHATTLTASQIEALVSAATRIGEHFGAAQDIEWAFDDTGLVLLQVRPVTRGVHLEGPRALG